MPFDLYQSPATDLRRLVQGRVSLMQMYIQPHTLPHPALIPDPSTSYTPKVRIGVKNNRRARSRGEITTSVYQVSAHHDLRFQVVRQVFACKQSLLDQATILGFTFSLPCIYSHTDR